MGITTDAKVRSVLSGTVLLIAVGGGMIGGYFHGSLTGSASAQAESAQLVRTRAIELVDSAGNRVGFLGADERGNASLAFFDTQGKKRAEFGIQHREYPHLRIMGPDGSNLITLNLGLRAKPRLMLSDHDFNGRVYLGVAEPDATDDPEWKYDTWVLRFRGDRGQPFATMGMTTGEGGGVTVFDSAGRHWRTQLK